MTSDTEKIHVPSGSKIAFSYPFFTTLGQRQSRRFPLGCQFTDDAFPYKSKHNPVPLSEEEEALLVWAATGIAGQTLSDILPSSSAACTELSWTRRTWPSQCSAHSTQLFLANDQGIWFVDVRGVDAEHMQEGLASAETHERMVEEAIRFYRKYRRRVSSDRKDILDRIPLVTQVNEWWFNKPGTTLFIPVTEYTEEYINILSLQLGPHYRFRLVDDFHGNRPAGTERWVKKGVLDGKITLPLRILELNQGIASGGEQGFMLQNVALAVQTLGLGGHTFGGFAQQILLGGTPICKGLGFRFATPNVEPKNPYPLGKDGFLETYHPYWFGGSIEKMVRAFFDRRRSKYLPNVPKAFKDAEKWMAAIRHPDEQDIQIVIDVIQYVWDTFGRFPALLEPVGPRILFQAVHLDIEFYDRYFLPGAYTQTVKDHFRNWHPNIPDPYQS